MTVSRCWTWAKRPFILLILGTVDAFDGLVVQNHDSVIAQVIAERIGNLIVEK